MPAVKVTVHGARETEQALLRLANMYGYKNAIGALRTAVRQLLLPVLAEIKKNTPVDTGALRDSSKLSITTPTLRAIAKRQYLQDDSVLDAGIGWYWSKPSLWRRALAVEFGNLTRPATPVIVPAFERNLTSIREGFSNTLKTQLEKTAKRLRRRSVSPRGLRIR